MPRIASQDLGMSFEHRLTTSHLLDGAMYVSLVSSSQEGAKDGEYRPTSL